MTCERWDVVVVPFPFTDQPGTKRRPALVLSAATLNRGARHTVLAMVTSKAHARWPGDVEIRDLSAAGLRLGCIVRPKLFTLDNRLIQERIGTLAPTDVERASQALRSLLP